MISAKVNLSITVSKKAAAHPMKRIDWKEVSSNSDLSKDFVNQVYNKVQVLPFEIDYDNVEDIHGNLAIQLKRYP